MMMDPDFCPTDDAIQELFALPIVPFWMMGADVPLTALRFLCLLYETAAYRKLRGIQDCQAPKK